MPEVWHAYMVRCADGTLYAGITNDVQRRVEMHNQGKGARYTRGRLPVVLVYQEEAGSRSAATRRETAIKRLPRSAKLVLAGRFP
jgi:predicted GIY-YIG superfamily endonuclease